MIYSILFSVFILASGFAITSDTGPAIRDAKPSDVADFAEDHNRVVVVYGAAWCPACVEVEKMLPELTKDTKVKVLKINTDVHQLEYIEYIPYFEVYVNGKKTFSGNVDSREQLQGFFK